MPHHVSPRSVIDSSMGFAQMIFTVVFCSFLDIQYYRRHLSMTWIQLFSRLATAKPHLLGWHPQNSKPSQLQGCFCCKGFHRWGQEECVTLGICARRSALGQCFSASATLTCVDSNSQNSPARKLQLAEVQRHCPRGHVQCDTKAFQKKTKPHQYFFSFWTYFPHFQAPWCYFSFSLLAWPELFKNELLTWSSPIADGKTMLYAFSDEWIGYVELGKQRDGW